MRQTAPTPKVFNAKYSPPKPKSSGNIKPKKPIIFAIAIIVGGLLFTRLPFFQIKSVELNGEISDQARTLTQSLIGESIFSSKISRISNQLLAENSNIAKFSCSRGIPATVRCTVVSREGVFNWKTSGKNYLVDKFGYAFVEASNETLPSIEDRANKPINTGDHVASEDIISSYSSLVAKLKDANIVTNQLFITESFYQFGAVLSGRVSPEQPFTASPVTTLFTTSYSLDAQVKVLNQLLQERSAQIKERIDLRVPGNVYYY